MDSEADITVESSVEDIGVAVTDDDTLSDELAIVLTALALFPTLTDTGSFVYRFNLPPLPQYSLLLPLQTIEHCDNSTCRAPAARVFPHQHSRPYSIPA